MGQPPCPVLSLLSPSLLLRPLQLVPILLWTVVGCRLLPCRIVLSSSLRGVDLVVLDE